MNNVVVKEVSLETVNFVVEFGNGFAVVPAQELYFEKILKSEEIVYDVALRFINFCLGNSLEKLEIFLNDKNNCLDPKIGILLWVSLEDFPKKSKLVKTHEVFKNASQISLADKYRKLYFKTIKELKEKDNSSNTLQ